MSDCRFIVSCRLSMRLLGDLQRGIDTSNANEQVKRSRR